MAFVTEALRGEQMTTTHRHLTHVLIAIGALALAMVTATPTYGKSGHALTVQAVAVRGLRPEIVGRAGPRLSVREEFGAHEAA